MTAATRSDEFALRLIHEVEVNKQQLELPGAIGSQVVPSNSSSYHFSVFELKQLFLELCALREIRISSNCWVLKNALLHMYLVH